MNSADRFALGSMSAEHFLGQYWQKQPLLIRRALPAFDPGLTANELAGLACEADIEARVISGSAGGPSWRLRHGPFDEGDYAALGERDWTLLVQAVDHHVPAVAQLRERFRFIPDWRLDDVMVSFAAPGGSVGPHFDQYDVFLLQGEGRRRWQIGQRCDANSPLLPHDELRLLERFETQETHVLEAGDLLYLPPGVAHWGVALEPCTTYSIGFRAPSHAEIISDFCDHLLQSLDDDQRYHDPNLALPSNPGLIDDAVAARLSAIVAPLTTAERLQDWFGRYMTQPKYAGANDECRAAPPTQADPPAVDSPLHLHPASRCAYRIAHESYPLYVDGNCYPGPTPSPPLWRDFVLTLCRDHRLDPDRLGAYCQDAEVSGTLLQLVVSGALETNR